MRRPTLATLVAVAYLLAVAASAPAPLAGAAGPPLGPDSQSCDTDPPDDYVQTIQGIVDGDPLELSVSARFGGAVESVTWRGKEFINIFDHGRQISYAWHFDGLSECLNPTEPGSANDSDGPTSTSQLRSVCLNGENSLTTTTQPAFWLAPGQGGFCSGGVETAQNETLLSDQILRKTIQIGYEGLDNVIEFTAEISLDESHDLMQLEIPTGYLTYEFTEHWRFNPATGELVEAVGLEPVPPWSFMSFGPLPPILSTADGAYAMGAYTAENILDYSILATNAPNPQNRTNKWNMVLQQQPADPGSYTYHSFVIVGTLESVQVAMQELFELHPVDLDPPSGFVDVFDCQEIHGWAWDPKAPNQPIEVEVYSVDGDGAETLLGQTTADTYRQDLKEALGDNGEHGFTFFTSQLLPDWERYKLRLYAINSHPDLPRRELYESGFTLACEQLGPPATEAPTGGPTEAPTATPLVPDVIEPTPEPGMAVPCLGALPLLAVGFILAVRRRSM